jgi:hypothetical protein
VYCHAVTVVKLQITVTVCMTGVSVIVESTSTQLPQSTLVCVHTSSRELHACCTPALGSEQLRSSCLKCFEAGRHIHDAHLSIDLQIMSVCPQHAVHCRLQLQEEEEPHFLGRSN